uniref:Uncharacterized protein n=1 Tax=Vibrio parahaemolyticus TaxID=670 RepID=A0A0C5HCX6_VIBPH|nr:hypothetical protein pVPH1_0119 [Vibrio parahaemolyticus]
MVLYELTYSKVDAELDSSASLPLGVILDIF